MKVVENFNGDAIWGVVPYIHESLKKLSSDTDTLLCNGAEWIYNPGLLDNYKDYKRKALLNLWAPCEIQATKNYFHFDAYEKFTDVYCVCPYTCGFMNKYFGTDKFKYIPYLFTNYSVTEFGNYDAIGSWMGSINGQEHISAIDVISKFPYKFITTQMNTWMHHPYEYNKYTHLRLSNPDKLKELSKARSSLCFNKLYNHNSINNGNYKGIPNKVFDHFDKGIMPQFKVRVNEIASCKSLILCHKDPWNLIDDFYEPGEEFIYFNNFEELENILIDVRDNFDKYIPIIEKAYIKSQNYTVEKIFKYMETNDQNLITWSLKNV